MTPVDPSSPNPPVNDRANRGERWNSYITKDFFDTNNGVGVDSRRLLKPHSREKLVEWVLTYSRLRGNERLLALQPSSYYNKSKGYSYPSYDTLREKTGLSRSTLTRTVKGLKLSGEWLVVTLPNPKGTTINRYYPVSPQMTDTIVGGEWEPFIVHRDVASYQEHLRYVQREGLLPVEVQPKPLFGERKSPKRRVQFE